jgi:GT2 family glycosyltransferase
MVDIGAPLRPLDDVIDYPAVRVFVRDGAELVGSVDIANARRPVSAARLTDAIAEELWRSIAHRAVHAKLQQRQARESAPAFTTSVSIVVPACDRPDDLRRCLSSLVAQQTRHQVEVVVVDNRPGRGGARAVAVDFPGVRLIEEPRAGLSYARNAGFAASCGKILVATDDDVVAPPEWVEKLVAPFASAAVMAVTGHVLPLELETESQFRFEAYGGLGKGFERRVVDGTWFHGTRAAVPTWILGATANAAFRAAAFTDSRIGMLDEALGAGTPTGCSEDTYLFYRILKQGHTIVYEPSAWVWHRHRTTMQSLRRQIHAYSKGHVAYHLTTLMRDGDRRALVRLGWSLPKHYVVRAIERLRGESDHSLKLLALEIAGNLAGPWALWASRRRVRRLGPGARCVARDPDGTAPAEDARVRTSPPAEATNAL